MLRPYETAIATDPPRLIHAISTNAELAFPTTFET